MLNLPSNPNASGRFAYFRPVAKRHGALVFICLLLGVLSNVAFSKAAHPNLIFIMVDDLGYGDLGCYGNTFHRTPNIDQLAAEGARLTNYYVTSPVCTPTRYALLTGKHPARVEMFEVLWPPTEGGMAPEEVTMAEWLREHGYKTGLAGKWHLGHSEPELLPPAQGFDDWYGMPYPNDMDADHVQAKRQGGDWPPMPMYRQYEIVEAPIDVNLLTQQYTAEAVRFVAENHHRPFFLFLSHAMPHTHLGASQDFRGKSANGLFGDSVEELDWSVGEIMRTLRAFDLDQRTLVVFTSDNGAGASTPPIRQGETEMGVGSNYPLRGGKGECYEGGIRVPGIFRWSGTIEAGLEIDSPAIITDTIATFAELADLPKMPTALDSVSLAPLLFGHVRAQERILYFGSGDVRAARNGKWKYHLTGQPSWRRDIIPEPMLFDLANDPGESENLINQYPLIAEELHSAIYETQRKLNPSKRLDR